jgi:hypothetical protein
MIDFSLLHQWLLGREFGVAPMDHLAELGILSGDLFLRVVESIQLCWISVKGCYVWHVMDAYVSCVSSLIYLNQS